MIFNFRADVSMTINKPKKCPTEKFYKKIEERIKEELRAESVEIVDCDFYDEDEEEMETEWEY